MSLPQIIKQAFQVKFSFNLIFSNAVFKPENTVLVELLTNPDAVSKALVIIDTGVIDAHKNIEENIHDYFNKYHDVINLAGPIIKIPGGENSKNNESYIKSILEHVDKYSIDRHSYIIAIGGGAVLDAVGYAAAIAHRGIRLIRIPTTILSQNDSGIGVKNSINYFGKKNFVGTFASPYAVINDTDFLSTLNNRDWRSGISEAIKVALIKDYDFFVWIEDHTELLCNRDIKTMQILIYKCAKMHMDHIANSGDAFELGSSRPLDFGHWSAHKLEQLSNYAIKHGEAVATGIALDSTYSFLAGYLKKEELLRILNCIISLGFNINYKEMNAQLIKGLEEFREHLGGQLTIMLLKSLGVGFEVHSMDKQRLLESIEFLHKYNTEAV